MLSLPLLLFVSALQAQDCSLGTHHLIGDLSTVVATNPGVVHATELSPEEKAFLDVIAYAEGVGASYNTMYGGKTFSGTQHPRKWTPSPWGTPGVGSDAAGRYQFLSTTWDEAADGIGVSRGAFTPINQDRAAIWLIKKEGKSVQQRAQRHHPLALRVRREEHELHLGVPAAAALPGPAHQEHERAVEGVPVLLRHLLEGGLHGLRRPRPPEIPQPRRGAHPRRSAVARLW